MSDFPTPRTPEQNRHLALCAHLGLQIEYLEGDGETWDDVTMDPPPPEGWYRFFSFFNDFRYRVKR